MALRLHALRSGKQYLPTGVSVAPSRQLTARIQELKQCLVNLNLHWHGPPTINPDTSCRDKFLVGAWFSCPKKLVCKQVHGSMPVDDVVAVLKKNLRITAPLPTWWIAGCTRLLWRARPFAGTLSAGTRNTWSMDRLAVAQCTLSFSV